MHSFECALTTQMQISVDSSNDNIVKKCRVTKKVQILKEKEELNT